MAITIDSGYQRELDRCREFAARAHAVYDGIVEVMQSMDIRHSEWLHFNEVRRTLAIRVIEADKIVESLLEPLRKAGLRG
jgi:hypothetical protein